VYVNRNPPEVASTNATSSQMVAAAVPKGRLLAGINAPPELGGQVIFLQLNAQTKVSLRGCPNVPSDCVVPYDASVIEANSALVG
jgi:hypothetical protein